MTPKDPIEDLQSIHDQPGEPFTELERKRLRKLLQDDDRATWFRRQVRVLTPWLIAVVGGLYGFWNYVSAHWKSG